MCVNKCLNILLQNIAKWCGEYWNGAILDRLSYRFPNMLNTRYHPPDKMASKRHKHHRIGARSSGRFSFWRSRPRFFIIAVHSLFFFPSQRVGSVTGNQRRSRRVLPWHRETCIPRRNLSSNSRTFFPCGVLSREV